MRKVSDEGCTDTQNTRLMLNNCFFNQNSCRLRDNVEWCGTVGMG